MKLALIGAGKWGKKYVSAIHTTWPNIEVEIGYRENWQEVVDKRPDGVMVCTAPAFHIDVAERAMQQCLPVMVEKPLALSRKDAERLLPYQHQAPILVNYIHLFSDYFSELAQAVSTDGISHISSLAGNMGPFRSYSALFDYGPHDIAMCLALFKEYPHKIRAKKTQHAVGEIYDITLHFINGKAEITIGNAFSHKIRHMAVTCNGKELVYDDGAILGHKLLGMQSAVKYETPPLTNAIKCFLNLIAGRQDERAGLKLSLQVMRILDECSKQTND